jgi:hypothetical protein
MACAIALEKLELFEETHVANGNQQQRQTLAALSYGRTLLEPVTAFEAFKPGWAAFMQRCADQARA